MESKSSVKITECPRDAMQGWKRFIPTGRKIAYLNALLKVGFDTIDFGSFVSPKAVPQMADTREVIGRLDYKSSRSKLLSIVANLRGAEEAVRYEAITYLGYPFSISETFQLRNTNKTIEASADIVRQIQELCERHGKQLVVYISMGFGNPYGDAYSREIVFQRVSELTGMGIRIISLADTVGMADAETIAYLFSHLVPAFRGIELGAHFHAAPQHWEGKLAAAYDNGCSRFDAAVNGIGGCPMAGDKLVGNMATENIVYFFKKRGVQLQLDEESLAEARRLAAEIFV